MRISTMMIGLSALLASATQAAEPPPLATDVARYQSLPREYRLDGVVEAINESTISAQTQGQVEEINFDVNDFVEKGAVIVRIKDTEHRARVAQAVAEVKSSAAHLHQTDDEYHRVKGLFEKKNVSESSMDQATADLEAAQAALDSANASLEEAREQLGYTQIRAPYSGIVTERHVELGEIVSAGSPVMTGVSLDALRVVVDVPQSIVPSIRKNLKARVYGADGQVIETDEMTIFPFADPDANTFKVRVRLPARTQSLFPGMYVKTGFVVGVKDELVIPGKAVIHRSEVTGVYVVDKDGNVSLRQIRTGRVLGDQVVVLAGLSRDEHIALDPVAAGVTLKEQSRARAQQTEEDHG